MNNQYLTMIVIGDIVHTPDGYGRVANLGSSGLVDVWVFGKGILVYDPSSLQVVKDPTPYHYGIGIIERQAAVLRLLTSHIKALRRQIERQADASPSAQPIRLSLPKKGRTDD